MDFCFSAGVIGWHEHMGLEKMNWISGSLDLLLALWRVFIFSSMKDSLNVRASDTMT